jgi:hypothetical protein
MEQGRNRLCAVCGRRHGLTYGYQSMLAILGLKGVWATPDCITKLVSYREAERRLKQTTTDPD